MAAGPHPTIVGKPSVRKFFLRKGKNLKTKHLSADRVTWPLLFTLVSCAKFIGENFPLKDDYRLSGPGPGPFRYYQKIVGFLTLYMNVVEVYCHEQFEILSLIAENIGL